VSDTDELKRLLRERTFILNWLQEQDDRLDSADVRAIRRGLFRQQPYVEALRSVEHDLMEWFRINEIH